MTRIDEKALDAAGRALVKQFRIIWPKGGFPALKEARQLVTAALSALEPAPAEAEGWRDDPAADGRWSAGLDYGQNQLCHVLGIDPRDVMWDAATETLDGDVRSVIGNILTQRFGDDWSDLPPAPAGKE